MAPPVSFTKATLSYPLYSADFDPYNRGYLVVAGGGGEGRSGVSNKITLLDTSSRTSLDVAAEIELSRDEDSVTTVASLASKDGLITLAGINSSEAEQKAGKNEHLRAFQIRYPKRRRKDEATDNKDDGGSISLIGKSSLFIPATGPKPEQYQRLLKLSPAQRTASGSKRIGVVATGLAKKSQLVIFDATRTPVQKSEVISAVGLDEEAADLDVINVGADFSIAWCTDYGIFEQTVKYDFETKQKELIPKGHRNVYTLAKEDKHNKPRIRPKYRSIRFLTDHHVLVLSNLPNKSGAELSIIHLYPTGPGMVVFHKILPSHVKQAVGMDVCALDADEVGSRQIVVAVASQDISIAVFTINYTRQTDTFSPFKKFTTLRDVHPLQMTAIKFASFFAPEAPKGDKRPQSDERYVRLASVSMGNTVVVDTFAVEPMQSKKTSSRYVLSHPAVERFTQTVYYVMGSLIVVFIAITMQSYFFGLGEQRLQKLSQNSAIVAKPPVASTIHQHATPKLEEVIHKFAEHSDKPAAPDHEQGYVQDQGTEETAEEEGEEETEEPRWSLLDMLHLHRSEAKKSGRRSRKAIVLQQAADGSGGLSMEEIHDRDEYLAGLEEGADAPRHWHELDDEEKHGWREALVKAGEWTVDEGESVLKGILFSSYAGFVGQVAAEAIRGA